MLRSAGAYDGLRCGTVALPQRECVVQAARPAQIARVIQHQARIVAFMHMGGGEQCLGVGRIVLEGEPCRGLGAMGRVQPGDLPGAGGRVRPGQVLEALPFVVQRQVAAPALQERSGR